MIALSAFVWSHTGGCPAHVTATVKHRSSAILRRLGGSSLKFQGQELPRYYDPEYECEMEILKFETRSLNSRFESLRLHFALFLLNRPLFKLNGLLSNLPPKRLPFASQNDDAGS